MKLSSVLVVSAIVSILFGIGFVAMPAAALAMYGVSLNTAGLFMTQLFGAALIEIGLVAWAVRYAADPGRQRGIALGFCVGTTIGFVVALQAVMGGVVNALGWSTVVLYGGFALAFGYLRFFAGSTAGAAPAH